MELIDDFKEVRECTYKDERYSVRDNGAVMRHARNGARLRKYDNVWTFGVKNEKTGYMTVGTARVHIIVATAFHGANDSTKLVVDHIDTNRCNNRPENLRWITRLENALNNPVTRKKIEFLCFGIENFIKDPSCLRIAAGDNQDIAWMRTVTREEAKNAYENVLRWAEYKKSKLEIREEIQKESPKQIDHSWIFKKHNFDLITDTENKLPSKIKHESWSVPDRSYDPIEEALEHKDSMPEYLVRELEYERTGRVPAKWPEVAVQVKWKTPTEFPCCPEEVTENSLKEYCSRLSKGTIFCTNGFWTSEVLEAALYDEGHGLVVMTAPKEGGMKLGVAKVYIEDGKILHETVGTYFSEDGALKDFTITQGLQWTGGDSVDDYC